MELITGINRVMAYTEQHLKEDLDCAKLAQLSGCSYADPNSQASTSRHRTLLSCLYHQTSLQMEGPCCVYLHAKPSCGQHHHQSFRKRYPRALGLTLTSQPKWKKKKSYREVNDYTTNNNYTHKKFFKSP